jgi:hypothetical protein
MDSQTKERQTWHGESKRVAGLVEVHGHFFKEDPPLHLLLPPPPPLSRTTFAGLPQYFHHPFLLDALRCVEARR